MKTLSLKPHPKKYRRKMETPTNENLIPATVFTLTNVFNMRGIHELKGQLDTKTGTFHPFEPIEAGEPRWYTRDEYGLTPTEANTKARERITSRMKWLIHEFEKCEKLLERYIP